MTRPAAPTDPVMPEVEINLVGPSAPVEGCVVASEPCTNGKSNAFVRHLAIDVSGTPLAGRFHPGQAFGVVAPGVDGRGRPHKLRLYSIASPRTGEDGAGRVLSTTPKRLFYERVAGGDPDEHRLVMGVCSNYLCDLRVGDPVPITGPAGRRFLLPADPEAHDFVFVATGTGIAPFRGMILQLLEGAGGPVSSRVHLLMGSPYTSDLLYHELLCELASGHGNFGYHWAISREQPPGDGRAGGGVAGYVDRLFEVRAEMLRPLMERPRTILYICGIQGMQSGVYRTLRRMDLLEGYATVAPELAGIDPADWSAEQIRRQVRPTARCLVEVY